jgi:alkaline phosphatase D
MGIFPNDRKLSRRGVLRAGLIGGGGLAAAALAPGSALAAPGGAPAFIRNRPLLTHGIQSGDVAAHTGLVWARADRPSRMLVEVSGTPSFRNARLVRGPAVTAATDLTGKVRLSGLPGGRRVFYRVRLQDDHGVTSAPELGSFTTAPVSAQDLDFVWSGDLAGQGWGINPAEGGFRIFRAMERLEPDFFLCSGDTVYADGPVPATQALPDGRVWRNVTSDAKSKVAETLAEYRGQYAYNLTDANLRRFNSHVAQVNQWDDHEVRNNWYPGQILDDPRYTEKRIDVLAARAARAFHEWVPIEQVGDEAGRVYRKRSYGPLLDVFVLDMRTYKDPNGPNRYADPRQGLLGTRQREWLKRELVASRASWKVIANDLPLGLVVPDGPTSFEGVAQGDDGAPAGRELEFAEILRHAHRHRVDGIVLLTADVHYTAAHHYDPARAAVQDFTPFWEFVSGPLNAGAFGPNPLDGTFGPRTAFVAAPPHPNASPAEGYQFFGHVSIDGRSRVMTVRLRDIDGTVLWSTELHPGRP